LPSSPFFLIFNIAFAVGGCLKSKHLLYSLRRPDTFIIAKNGNKRKHFVILILQKLSERLHFGAYDYIL
jgi:hypothetical protein